MSIEHLNEVLLDPEMTESLKRRFAAKVKVEEDSECWPWVAKAVARYGYGRMTAGRGRYLRAHQVAWALKNGPIPDGAVIRHTCDNPACCNPSHLKIGTQAENIGDAVRRGRNSPPPHRTGEAHPSAKLTARQVEEIRASQETLEMAAARYGVSSKTIWRIRKNHQWRDP